MMAAKRHEGPGRSRDDTWRQVRRCVLHRWYDRVVPARAACGINLANGNMPDANSDPARFLLQPFLTFLHHAVLEKQKGQAEACAIWLQAASYLYATDDGSVSALTDTLIRQGRHADAISLADVIAQLRPDNASASFRLGYALQMANRHGDAVAPYRRALAVDPDMPKLRNNLAIALRSSGDDRAEELALLESAVTANPQESESWINLTYALHIRMDLDGALHAGARAVEVAPDNPLARNNYALALKEAQRWDEAGHHARAACELAPADAAFRLNLAILHLVRGNFIEGWPEQEARWNGAGELRGLRPVFPRPQWQGESLAGKTLFVWGEQGMGDLLQCCRFIPLLAARVHRDGGRVVWNSFPQMGALLVRSLGEHVDGYTAGGDIESLPPFDYELPLLSVPLVLGTQGDTLAGTVPYLRPDAVASERWRARLATEKRLKVGLVWTGSLHHQRNPFRRVGLDRYASSFAGIDGAAFYSLQPGASADVVTAQKAGLEIADYTSEFTSFDDTAAFISALDLVISVCTSVAHLSGALGQRTWVLLDVNPHWAWLLERRDSPWYPDATLYRQRQFGQWDPVLEAVASDLAALVRAPG